MASVRVLLIEDSPSAAALFQAQLALRDGDIEVEWVPSLADARARVSEADCTLLDLTLSDGQGLEAVDGITDAAPDMPVIVLTGLDDEAGGLEAVRRGAQDYLVKDDIKGRDLGRAIRYAIERKNAETNLVALADQLEERTRALAVSNSTIFNDSYTAMVQLSPSGLVISANRAMAFLLGAPGADLSARSVTDLFTQPDGAELANIVTDVFDTGIPHRRDALLVRDDGSTRLTALQLSRLTMGDSDHDVILVTVGDITAGSRAMLRQANDQKLAELGRLAAGIAHEIRSPMQYVTTSVEFVRTSIDEILVGKRSLDNNETRTDLRESLDEVADGIGRINEIVKGMNVLAHTGGSDMDHHDLNDALDFPLTVVRGQAPSDTEFAVTRGDLSPVRIRLGLMQQLLLNLLVNSIHAIEDRVALNPRSTGRIEVETATDADWVTVRVTDNGVGMSPDVLSHAMEPFFTTKSEGRGTGQGLAMVRDIAIQHNGHVTMGSSVEDGTSITVRLPHADRTETTHGLSA
jgi:PAS domain S-box-containing protein